MIYTTGKMKSQVSRFLFGLSPALIALAAAAAAATTTDTATPPQLLIYNSSSTYHYAGCWNETTDIPQSTNARALPDASEQLPGTMTVESCLGFCAHNRSSTVYNFAGVEYSRECWCGDRLSSLSVRLEDSACDTPCDGNATEACGGALRLSVYNITQGGGGTSGGVMVQGGQPVLRTMMGMFLGVVAVVAMV